MPDDFTLFRPDEHTANLITIRANYAERYVRTTVSQRCGYFYVFMEQVSKSPLLMALVKSRSRGSPTDFDAMVKAVNELRTMIETLAKTVAMLDRGELELVAWRYAGEDREVIRIGVWRKGQINPAKAGPMEWLPLPVLVLIGAAAVVATAGAYLADLYLSADKIGKEADLMRAMTEQAMMKAIAESPPDDRADLVAAFEKAQAAAKNAAMQGGTDVGWLGVVGKTIGALVSGAADVASSLVTSGSLPWVLLGGFVLFGMAGGKKRDRSSCAV
jgi:hypothetical protein